MHKLLQPKTIYIFFFFGLFLQINQTLAQQTLPDSVRKRIQTAPRPGQSSSSQVPLDQEELIQRFREAGMSERQIEEMLKRSFENNSNLVSPSNRPTTSPNIENLSGMSALDSVRRQEAAEIDKQSNQNKNRESVFLEEELSEEEKEQKIADSIEAAQNRIYGQHIFEELSTNFSRNQSVVPPDDYIIGPGDQLIVSIWGASELQESLVVDESGAIFRDRLGKIYVIGLTYGAIKGLLQNRYQNITLPGSNIEIILGQNRRTISVNIIGEVNEPGTYDIFANNSAYNALFEAQGIAQNGSVRNVQIKRRGRTVSVFDMYKFWLQGEEDALFLDNNDNVFVPVQGKVVQIKGSVKRPMRYELLDGEHLSDLIKYAGGLNFDARIDRIQVRRLENGKEVYDDVDLGTLIDKNENYILLDGDEVFIPQQRREEYNYVKIDGGVNYPDVYELTPGQRLLDLIERAGGLDTLAYLKRAYVTRVRKPGEIEYIDINLAQAIAGDTTQNLKLQFFDHVLIFLETDFQEEKYIHVIGEVRQPDSFLVSPSMSLKDVLLLAHGLKEDANYNNIELSTFKKADTTEVDSLKDIFDPDFIDESALLETEFKESDIIIRRVAIPINWEDDPNLDTVMVAPYNRVKVYSKFDFTDLRYIQVEGAVKNPGKYPIQIGMTLKDIIYQVGGLTKDADVKEVELYKEIAIQEKGFFSTSTRDKEIHRIALENDWQSSTIADSIEIFDYYRLVIRSERDFVQQGYVEIKGLVNQPGKFTVRPNMNLQDLIYMAGGLKMEADFDRIELSRVIEVLDDNGNVVPIPMALKKIATTQDWQKDSSLHDIIIRPFDQVFVRKNPEFEEQESIFVAGEIRIPGEYSKYSKLDKIERLSSLVERAGGLTDLAYIEGAYLKREGVGPISIKLDKALRRRGSVHDQPLLANDTLYIPPRLDVVTVVGNVRQPGTTVGFEPSKKRFKYYVNLAGGFDRRTRRKLSTVSYMDGRVKPVKSILGFKNYPKVEQGAVIVVARKPDKPEKEEGEKFKFSLQEILGTATAILTFYLLLDRTLP